MIVDVRRRVGDLSLTARPAMQFNSQGQSGDNSDGGSASYPHGLDTVKRFLTCGHFVIVVLVGQPELIQHVQMAAGVLDGL